MPEERRRGRGGLPTSPLLCSAEICNGLGRRARFCVSRNATSSQRAGAGLAGSECALNGTGARAPCRGLGEPHRRRTHRQARAKGWRAASDDTVRRWASGPLVWRWLRVRPHRLSETPVSPVPLSHKPHPLVDMARGRAVDARRVGAKLRRGCLRHSLQSNPERGRVCCVVWRTQFPGARSSGSPRPPIEPPELERAVEAKRLWQTHPPPRVLLCSPAPVR